MAERAVLDTNVIVSGMLSPRGASRAILEAARRNQVTVVTSPVLLDELEEVLERFMPRMAAVAARVAFEEQAHLVTPTAVPAVSRDPDDDHVVAAAITGDAAWVVTRDADLLSLGEHAGVRFVLPAPFLVMVRASTPE